MAHLMVQRVYFTDDVVGQLQHNFAAPKDFTYFQDEVIPELRLKVTAKRRIWYFYKTVKGRSREYALGDFPRVTARDARAVIEPMLKGCEFGEDPKRVRPNALKKRVPDYKDVFNAYLNDYLKPQKKDKEVRESEQSFKRCFQKFADMRVDEISRIDVQQWVNELGEQRGAGAANREFRRFAAALHYGEKMEMFRLETDPTKYITQFPERPRARYLTVPEMQRLMEVLQTKPVHQQDVVMVALSTAARKGNILAAEWHEFDLDSKIWRIPAIKYKSNRDVVLPLHDGAVALLRRRYATRTDERWVFPSAEVRLLGVPSRTGHITNFEKAWDKICEEAGLIDFHFHDLRHTVASWLAIDGASAFTIMQILGHSSIVTTNRYTHLNQDTGRAAMQAMYESLPTPGVVLAEPKKLPEAARTICLDTYRKRRRQ